MRSRPLEAPPPLDVAARASARVTWTVELRAVTPIYKGGARNDAVDPTRPVRASSVKGLLRFWWRALQAETDPKKLREAESERFGTAFPEPRASLVRVGVTGGSARIARKPEGADYVLWVHRGDERWFLEDARATLVVSAPSEQAEEVRRALQAWLLLGGIGSRSRRGLGALDAEHTELRPPLRDVGALVETLRALAPPLRERSWPSLGGGEILVGPPAKDARAAWIAAVEVMQAVRMDTGHGQRRPVALPFVPHRWHDDDYVRFAKGERFRSPRAALGLPLQFQQWGGGSRFSMAPHRGDRMPSPILLRPIRIGDGWCPAMVRLRAPSPRQLVVTQRGQSVRGELDPAGVDLFLADVARVPGWERHALGGGP